ncbi:hypothetical protein LAZ67_6003713 [Cordylochernes scorpioides]|uniref:RNA-dependent RNA polymerase n=1 Tax=Cordylochernes scorpioides TaxID=51811 RepID=A0ABY6KLV0_9ARAC|nr:hypothetical protein LAZ67_6003713 [Cordylochernes scorpioides]
MSGFKLKYTKFKALEGVPDCHCEAKLRELSIKSHFSLEEQAKEDKEASDMIFEVKNYANYFILKPNSNSGSFKNCLDVGFSWQEFSCYLCWLTLKKWKTLPSFELEHKDMCIDDLYMGSHVGIAQFNSHYHLKNSSLRCSFLHDRKEVIITLEDNKQILIQYSGLYRIFIFEVTDNVVLHLHLKTPPLLFQDSSQTTTLNICPVLSKEVVGNSNMIKIILVKKNNSHTEMKELLNRLRSRCPSAVDFIFANLFQENFSQPSIEQRIKVINHLKFSCFDSVYAWKVLLNHGYMVTDQIISGEMEAEILKKEKKNPRKFQEGCYALFRAMSNGNFLVFSDGFAFYYNRPLMHAQSNPEGICTVRKVVMTPSRRIFLPPQQHIVNRVLRNYDENYVLQVSIKQENMDSINFRLSSNSNENFMEENFNLKKGFRIGGRHYEFLACANSQLREHGFWISVRYKTLPDSYTVSYCNDIIRSGYNFSDGIGMISPLLAYELSGSKREDKYKPSAFQIRYPGCKGMLAVNCDLKGNEIRLRRPSMVKFKSNNKERVIDILKTSAPRE